MSNIATKPGFINKLLCGVSGVALGAACLSTAATQFMAWRCSYHPALGHPLLDYFGTPVYWPWKWVAWMLAPWASQIKGTITVVQLGLLLGALGMALLARWLCQRQSPEA